jgi:ABC-type transport system substrate-binding protein
MQAATESDPAKRFAQLADAEHLINTEMPIIPIYHYVNVTLLRDRVKGIEPNSRSMIVWKRVSVEAGK